MTSPHQISATAADAQVHQPERAPFTTWTGRRGFSPETALLSCFFSAPTDIFLQFCGANVRRSDFLRTLALKQAKQSRLESFTPVENWLNA